MTTVGSGPPTPVVAVLGRGVVPTDTPVLHADDLGVVHGDGVFETMHVRTGTAWRIDEHLDRMARGARLLNLALPAATALRELADQALAVWPPTAEGALRLVCTRGREGGGPVTVFATLAPVSAAVHRARRDGVAVLTAPLDVAAGAGRTAPWLLTGAKTVSYAANMAALRWAAAGGADDVLWVSSDGYALEGPTSTLVWLAGDALMTVPPEDAGILAGITAGRLLDRAASLALDAGTAMITPAGLRGTGGVWLLSSVRGVAEVRSLDGDPMPAVPELTRRFRELLGFSAP